MSMNQSPYLQLEGRTLGAKVSVVSCPCCTTDERELEDLPFLSPGSCSRETVQLPVGKRRLPQTRSRQSFLFFPAVTKLLFLNVEETWKRPSKRETQP